MTPIAIPCLHDNFAYLVRTGDRTAVIDAPEAGPILTALAARGWGLDELWLTHHHDDHTQATAEIVRETSARVFGAGADAHRLPPLDTELRPGPAEMLGEAVEIIDVPGHTVGHLAFYHPRLAAAFTADSLMAMGCGRVFEGTPEMMWNSLQRLDELPEGTLICSGHDYLDVNARFALSVEPDNAAIKARLARVRQDGAPAAIARLEDERDTNPFLRAAKLAPALGARTALEAFSALRARRDHFA